MNDDTRKTRHWYLPPAGQVDPDEAPATKTTCPACERWDLEADPDRYCDVCKTPPPPRLVDGPVRDAWMAENPEAEAASTHPSEMRKRQ